MPAWIRTLAFTVLIVGTVSGWAAAIFLGTQVLPEVQASDEQLANTVRSYVTTYVTVQKEADGYERLEPFLAGPALDALQRESDAGAEPVGSLSLISGDFEVVWRSGNQAMVSADFTLESSAAQIDIGEHYLLQMVDGRWKIVQRWRLQLDPGTPLVPGGGTSAPAASESASPAASGAPSPSEPQAAPSDEPAASDGS